MVSFSLPKGSAALRPADRYLLAPLGRTPKTSVREFVGTTPAFGGSSGNASNTTYVARLCLEKGIQFRSIAHGLGGMYPIWTPLGEEPC